MPSEITITTPDDTYWVESFTFAGGEQQVRIPGLPLVINGETTVVGRVQCSDDLIRLLLTTEVLARHQRSGRKRLVIPYFPYARQDRVMQKHEVFSLKPIVALINSLNYDEVVICDPHSEVTPALVDRVRVIEQLEMVRHHEGVGRIIWSNVTIVSPDAGAAKKAFAVAQYFRMPIITASKVRDVKTGNVIHTSISEAEHIAGRAALIVDDICHGGRTFIELAKVLRAAGAVKVYLYVTHGIFSQGLGVFQGIIDQVFTTNSFLSRDVETPHQSPVPLHVMNINF